MANEQPEKKEAEWKKSREEEGGTLCAFYLKDYDDRVNYPRAFVDHFQKLRGPHYCEKCFHQQGEENLPRDESLKEKLVLIDKQHKSYLAIMVACLMELIMILSEDFTNRVDYKKRAYLMKTFVLVEFTVDAFLSFVKVDHYNWLSIPKFFKGRNQYKTEEKEKKTDIKKKKEDTGKKRAQGSDSGPSGVTHQISGGEKVIKAGGLTRRALEPLLKFVCKTVDGKEPLFTEKDGVLESAWIWEFGGDRPRALLIVAQAILTVKLHACLDHLKFDSNDFRQCHLFLLFLYAVQDYTKRFSVLFEESRTTKRHELTQEQLCQLVTAVAGIVSGSVPM